MAKINHLIAPAVLTLLVSACSGPASEDSPAEPQSAPINPDLVLSDPPVGPALPPMPPHIPASTALIPISEMGVGEEVYRRWCAHCHAPGPFYPGTVALAASRSPEEAVILFNPYLEAGYIEAVVRNGLGTMPNFRTIEISDDELTALAQYIVQEAANAPPPPGPEQEPEPESEP